MILLGLTGGYCAGKNSAASVFEARGWISIDVDRLGHRALELSREAVLERFDPTAKEKFGRGLLDKRGELDRRLLGAIVFSDPRALSDHEAIVHPAMFRLVEERVAEIAEAGGSSAERRPVDAPRILINAAILYKMPILKACAAAVEVRASLPVRLARARARDGLGLRRALDRIGRQAPLWKLRPRREPPVFPLANSGTREELEGRIDRLLDAIGPLLSAAASDRAKRGVDPSR